MFRVTPYNDPDMTEVDQDSFRGGGIDVSHFWLVTWGNFSGMVWYGILEMENRSLFGLRGGMVLDFFGLSVSQSGGHP